MLRSRERQSRRHHGDASERTHIFASDEGLAETRAAHAALMSAADGLPNAQLFIVFQSGELNADIISDTYDSSNSAPSQSQQQGSNTNTNNDSQANVNNQQRILLGQNHPILEGNLSIELTTFAAVAARSTSQRPGLADTSARLDAHESLEIMTTTTATTT